MRAPHAARAAPACAGGDPQIEQAGRRLNSQNTKADTLSQSIPSKATLARKWPRLRVNRYTGAWCDGASGTKGDTIESLLAFLREGGR
jgi:hypothetical protein